MGQKRGATVGPALLGGVLIALSLPPVGVWPLGLAGLGLLGHLLAGRPARTRALVGFAGGVGVYGVTLWWITEFNLIGGFVVMAIEAAFLAAAALATPPGKARSAGWIGAVVAQEWFRSTFPLGGVPAGGIAIGQAGGPLAPAGRLGGALLVVGLAAAGGVALEGLACLVRARRVPWAAVAAATVMFGVVVAADYAPDGGSGPALRVAVVQGGGTRGLRAIHSSADAVLQAAFAASATIPPPVDAILWPEDVVALDGPVAGSGVADRIGAVAARFDAPLLAGVTEDVGPGRFRNAQVVWDEHGAIVDRYDKVHRVPFGEYVPGRALISTFVSLAAVPRDAIAGHGSGLVRTDRGRFGVVISFEVYFSGRARSAIRAGGEVLLGPTNTASYRGTQVTSSEVATARLRAWETGRDVLLAAPTGYSAVIDSHAHVRQRSSLGARQVLVATVHRRTGQTPYVRWGDAPVLVAAAVLIGGGRLSRSRDLDQAVNSGKP
ncbi:MAG: hypothetical protein NVSMB12_21990 [Acidimicrobiales bacterium]